MGYNPQSHKESDTTQATEHTLTDSIYCVPISMWQRTHVAMLPRIASTIAIHHSPVAPARCVFKSQQYQSAHNVLLLTRPLQASKPSYLQCLLPGIPLSQGGFPGKEILTQ